MYYYIVNPAAGNGLSRQTQDRIKAKLERLGIAGEWALTTGQGEAGRLAAAAEARGVTTIVAVGGDDTLNEVMNGLKGESAALGVVPVGVRNRLARQLGINSWAQACDVLAARRLTRYNLMAAGQRFFLSTLNLGFDTHLDKSVDQSDGGVGSTLGQIGQSWRQAKRFGTLEAKIAIDDTLSLSCKLFSLSVSNQKFLAPFWDNRLVLTLRDRPGQRQLGSYLYQRVIQRDFPQVEGETSRLFAQRVVIETTPITGFMIDGKVAGRTPIAIRLTNRRVRLITEKVSSTLR